MNRNRFASFLTNYEEFIHTKGSSAVSSHIATLIFTVFLIGGIIYLATGLEKDHQRYIEMYEPIIDEIAELENYDLMSNVLSSNWYLDEENQQAELALFELIFIDHKFSDISEDIQNDAETWCVKANVESSSDLIRITEYSFTSEPLSQYQKRHVLLTMDYQAQTTQLCDSIRNWNSYSLEQKNEAFDSLGASHEASKVTFAQFEEIGRINELEIQRKLEKAELISDRAERLRLFTMVKTVASFGGIVVGAITILLFFQLISFAPNVKKKPTPKNQGKAKKK